MYVKGKEVKQMSKDKKKSHYKLAGLIIKAILAIAGLISSIAQLITALR
jgi:hypothetical protein